MKYNTDRTDLIIPEYGRHIHSMANSLLKIEDRVKRNQQAQILINIMGNLNPHLRDVEEYKHKLWDHLFIMCSNKLDVEHPPYEPVVKLENKKERIANTQGSVKYKHYGKLITLLIQETLKIKDDSLKNHAIEQIAKQMKRAYLNWNQTNVQDVQIWSDLERMADGKIDLDKSKIIPVFPTNPIRKKPFYKKSNRKNYSKK